MYRIHIAWVAPDHPLGNQGPLQWLHFVSTYGSSKSAFVVTLVPFEKKVFASPQVPLKTKYVVTLVAFEEEKRFCESSSSSQN